MRRITFKHVLGVLLLLSFNQIIWYALTRQIPTENRELVIHSLGMLEGFIGAIVMYHYGDSAGSKRKTEIINEQLNEKANNTRLIDNNDSPGSGTE